MVTTVRFIGQFGWLNGFNVHFRPALHDFSLREVRVVRSYDQLRLKLDRVRSAVQTVYDITQVLPRCDEMGNAYVTLERAIRYALAMLADMVSDLLDEFEDDRGAQDGE